MCVVIIVIYKSFTNTVYVYSIIPYDYTTLYITYKPGLHLQGRIHFSFSASIGPLDPMDFIGDIFMVVQWWFNGGLMVVLWWFNGGLMVV